MFSTKTTPEWLAFLCSVRSTTSQEGHPQARDVFQDHPTISDSSQKRHARGEHDYDSVTEFGLIIPPSKLFWPLLHFAANSHPTRSAFCSISGHFAPLGYKVAVSCFHKAGRLPRRARSIMSLASDVSSLPASPQAGKIWEASHNHTGGSANISSLWSVWGCLFARVPPLWF